MRKLIPLLLLAAVTITLDDREQQILTNMCQMAKWAGRMQMEGICEHFDAKVQAEKKKLEQKDAK